MRKDLPLIDVVSTVFDGGHFHSFDMEKVIGRVVDSRRLLQMTLCPVMAADSSQSEAFHSLLFGQSPLFGVSSMWANHHHVEVHQIVKVDIGSF